MAPAQRQRQPGPCHRAQRRACFPAAPRGVPQALCMTVATTVLVRGLGLVLRLALLRLRGWGLRLGLGLGLKLGLGLRLRLRLQTAPVAAVVSMAQPQPAPNANARLRPGPAIPDPLAVPRGHLLPRFPVVLPIRTPLLVRYH